MGIVEQVVSAHTDCPVDIAFEAASAVDRIDYAGHIAVVAVAGVVGSFAAQAGVAAACSEGILSFVLFSVLVVRGNPGDRTLHQAYFELPPRWCTSFALGFV